MIMKNKYDKRNIISVDDFIERIRENLEPFRQNMKNLGGKFAEPKTLSKWITMFSNWNR